MLRIHKADVSSLDDDDLLDQKAMLWNENFLKLAHSILNVYVAVSEGKAGAMKDHVQLSNMEVIALDVSEDGNQDKSHYMYVEGGSPQKHFLL
mmetsp:Transcript_2822/g.6118  ORF Transcript_2822/g.6118 Transcript_2822/m.6118 type:complete len:93 (-) Transcript_2822:307-585(-)